MAEPSVRRADFLMTLAYATDLATGHSRDFALRSCVLAMRLAEVAGLDDHTRRNVYHQALLRYIGCNADTHLLAAAFGDEIALRRDLQRIDIGNKSELAETIVRAITRTFADAPPAELAKAVECENASNIDPEQSFDQRFESTKTFPSLRGSWSAPIVTPRKCQFSS
jgi:hypothetical protein